MNILDPWSHVSGPTEKAALDVRQNMSKSFANQQNKISCHSPLCILWLSIKKKSWHTGVSSLITASVIVSHASNYVHVQTKDVRQSSETRFLKRT